MTIALDRACRRTDSRKPPRCGGHSNAGRSDEPPGDLMMREELTGRRSSGQGHEDGDAERLSQVAERGVHGGPSGEAIGGQAGDGGRREQRQHHRDADARHEREGQPDGEVSRSGIRSREQEQRRGRGDDAARNQDRTLPDPSRESPELGGEQEDDEWPRRHGEPGPDRRVTPDLAEKLDVPEKHDREPRAVEKLAEVRPAEPALGEEVEREHRVRDGGAPSGERGEQHDSAEERSHGPGTRPPPRAGLNDREGEENERDGDDNRPDGGGQPRTVRLARLGQQPPSEDRDGDADRNVDDEHRAPTPRFDEEPTDGWTQRGGQRPRRSPERDGLRNPGLREGSQDQRQRRGDETRGPEPLQDSGGDEHADAWSDRADRRSHGEDTHSGEKDTTPAEAICPSAHPDHPRRDDDRVTGKDPRQRG